MNKTELIAAVAEKSGLSKKDAEKALSATIETIIDAVKADDKVQFQVEGAGFIAGVDNGSPISMERFKSNQRKAFYGKCLVVIQNNGQAGAIRLKAKAEGLPEVTCQLSCK